MKRTIRLMLGALLLSAFIGACGGGGGGAAAPPPVGPAPAAQNPSGMWTGTAVTPDIPDIVTSFETVGAGDFTVGAAPFTATFAGGAAKTVGTPGLYSNGDFSWHVAVAGTVTFATPGSTLSFSTRTVTAGDNATIQVLDENGVEIPLQLNVVPDAFAVINVTRDPAIGQSLIGSVVITVISGEIVIDSFTFGFPSIASTDEVACLIAPNNEFVCVVADATTGGLVAGANGTVSVAVDQVSGMGWLYAAPGESFADGSTIAALTISAGTVAENTSLDLTVDGTGVSIDFTTTFDPVFDRGSDPATVAASWLNFDIFGDASTFDVDAMGAISGTSAATCMLMGQVSVNNPTVNAYDVAITVTDGGNCGVPAGDYIGLGAIQDDLVMDDNFIFGVFVDGVSMIIGDVDKP